jgi:hydrogenase maturation protein HypF
MEIRRHIEVSGIVQGVGFRPFVYRLARSGRLTGKIRNTSAGVSIEIQGMPQAVSDFVQRLSAEAPPLAYITDVSVRETPCSNETEFRIESSRGPAAEMETLIAPDVAVCADCLRELLDPSDRRCGYPFINCTNCGPRFSIVRDIPYDRALTSMAMFAMCPACQSEYDDPLNRRFHAQPNACWKCGPQLELWDSSGAVISCADPIEKAVEALKAGNIIAVKGLGGFHLTVDVMNPRAIHLLRERKHRVDKPFAVMLPNIATAYEVCDVSTAEQGALESVQRPIVLLRRKDQCDMPEELAPFHRELGVFLPYTPVHHLLFQRGKFRALVMTSANLSEEPIAIDNREAVQRLRGITDLFLVHNRKILLRCDDSVVRVTNRRMRQLRRSRGFVPMPIFLKDGQLPILAVGGELKNTVCLTKGKHAFLSQHIGDLENAESYEFFEEAVTHLKTILEIEPKAIAYDLHPDYFSTKWALQQNLPTIGVQHHHAHITSCMAENHLDGRVIGFALDGTGYGTDGNMWGSEVLIADYESFDRFAHLEYVSLPGGEAAIREPWRMAVSYLVHHFGRAFLNFRIPFLRNIDLDKTAILLRMIERDVNCPLTSGAGRLFDAVSALIGIRLRVNYEAQAAIELENRTWNSADEGTYPLDVIPQRKDGKEAIISTQRLFQRIVEDLQSNIAPEIISRRFHNGVIDILVKVALLARDKTNLDRVCLSGGTFNNAYLCNRLEQALCAAGFEVFIQHDLPAGDGGLSLGQAIIAVHKLQKSPASDLQREGR